MSWVILVRNPRNDNIIAIDDGNYEGSGDPPLAIYPTEQAAEEAAKEIPICRTWPYVVVEGP